MIIRIETNTETYTTEFHHNDVSIGQIAEALRGMLLSHGFSIKTINEYIKIPE